jgi:peptidase M28-like protein
MAGDGWKQLIEDWPWFRGEGRFPVQPNSEFMPPVRLLLKPYGTRDTLPIAEDDPWGWPITEYEEALTLQPGLRDLARHVLDRLVPLCRGDESHGIGQHKLKDNPYWPAELSSRSKTLDHERFVLLLPMALSLTQDDRAHVRWTLFGNSEQGPARAFWKGFWTAPDRELPAEQAKGFFRTLLAAAYEEPPERLANLHKAGFRILPLGKSGTTSPADGPLPSWTTDYLLDEKAPLRGVKYVLTFRPFRDLPAPVRRQYLAGDLNLLPFPGSLLFWGIDSYVRLGEHVRLAEQIPLLHMFERHEWPGRIRVPQSGWFQEHGPAAAVLPQRDRLPIRDTYKRTFRTARAHRFDDCYVAAHEHRLAHVLFSTKPHDIDLYHKPMARNVQLWAQDFRPLLDGPTAQATDIHAAAEKVAAGGLFGYRFLFPAMCVGRYELFWHRPLVAFLDRKTNRPTLVDNAPLGYLTAYRQDESRFDQPVELWPRLLCRAGHADNVDLFRGLEEHPPRRTIINVHKLLDAWERRGHAPLPRTFARQLLTIAKKETLEGWLRWLPLQVKARDRDRAGRLVDRLRSCLEPADFVGPVSNRPQHGRLETGPTKLPRQKSVPPTLTFQHTACRSFEEAYWRTIYFLSAGEFVNKNNADCVQDKPTHEALRHSHRDLEIMGDYLLDYYARLVADHDMSDSVQIGELPFRWHTDYPFPWMGGWAHNQDGQTHERNLMVRIPGRDRSRAVIMADHYDTAYMYDWYEKRFGGTGARLAAPGADDNCSATAALMLGAPAFLELSRQNRLDCDIWLIHLTGEEYPAEGQGTCRMCQWLIENTLALHTRGGNRHDLSGVRIQGVYVLDMIAHNNWKDRDVFQIAPGASRASLWLAYQAHVANQAWNRSTATWNRQRQRRQAGRGRRCADGKTIPPLSRFLPLHGEVRPHFDQRSTLFNTDGQAFSDVGIPVVLFMENYDINRVGYHDTHDNMNMINLDYGAALAAITIESVARAATETPPDC